MFDLTGRTAPVTGSGRGVGFGVAEVLLSAGATVYVNDLVAERAESAAASLGDRARPLPFDVADLDVNLIGVLNCVKATIGLNGGSLTS